MLPFRITWLFAAMALLCPHAWALKAEADPEAEAEAEEVLITTIIHEPYTKYDNDSKELVGFIPDLLAALCEGEYLTCDYELELVADGRWGKRSDDGEWSGMIGEVSRGEAAMAAAPLAITQIRSIAVDFSEPFADNQLTMLLNENVTGVEEVTDLLDVDIKFGCVKDGSTMTSIQQNPTDPYPRLWAKMSKMDSATDSVFVSSLAEGVEKARGGDYVLIGENDPLAFLALKHCSLETRGLFLEQDGYAFALQKGSTLKAKLDEGISKLKENGKMKELHDTWWKVDHCDACRSASSVFFLTLGAIAAYSLGRL